MASAKIRVKERKGGLSGWWPRYIFQLGERFVCVFLAWWTPHGRLPNLPAFSG